MSNFEPNAVIRGFQLTVVGSKLYESPLRPLIAQADAIYSCASSQKPTTVQVQSFPSSCSRRCRRSSNSFDHPDPGMTALGISQQPSDELPRSSLSNS